MAQTEQTVVHTIQPVYNANSRVLVLGTMPSPQSREQGFYYAHPQNRFWRVLTAVLGEPEPQDIEQKKTMLYTHGVALWDVLHTCRIRGAADSSIVQPVPNDLQPIFSTAPIRAVFTTGARAYALYEKYQRPQTGISAIRLPSTSAANCAMSFEKLVQAYRPILQALEKHV